MQDERSAIKLIKLKFMGMEQMKIIPLLDGGFFSARWAKDGIMVDSLGFYPLLPWIIFTEVINFLNRNNGRAEMGDPYSIKLGNDGIALESIEGHIARVVYGKKNGEVVLRRISPISAILVWAGVCENTSNELILR